MKWRRYLPQNLLLGIYYIISMDTVLGICSYHAVGTYLNYIDIQEIKASAKFIPRYFLTKFQF